MDRRTLLKRLFASIAVPALPLTYAEYARAAGLRGSAEWLYQALRGNVTGVTRVVITGTNADVDTAAVPEDLWGGSVGPGGIMPRAAAPESWELVSSSADDTAAGTGARSVSVETVGPGGALQTQTVVPNGLTAVALTGTHSACNAAMVASAGSLGTTGGFLTLRVAGGGATRGFITAPEGLLNQCRYTVPTGYRLDCLSLVTSLRAKLSSESALPMFGNRSPAGRDVFAVPLPLFASGTSVYRHEVSTGLVPFISLTAGFETNVRVFEATQNDMILSAAILALRFDNAVFPT